LLKNEKNLTEEQRKELLGLQKQKFETLRAYNIKESLGKFWECKSRDEAEQYLKKWYFWATHSKLEPVIKVAKTIKSHWDGILNYFDSRITNGILEGMNSIVQLTKRIARGYRNPQYFINMIYLKKGKLDFKLPT
jgi:transposase